MKPFYDISNHNGFKDLMNTTHHTGNAWLNKKLNNNNAYILASLAIGALGSALMGKPKAPQPYGGGFNPATKKYMEEGLKDLQGAYRQGPKVFEGPRVAAFDPAQQQAQASLMALSTAQPDYFQTATAGLGEAIDLQRQAGAAITPEMLAQQRQMLAPTIDAERQAVDIAFRESLRDIGVGAGGAGVGALTGARADIMRGGAAGERAMAEAQLQGRLTDQALGTLESQFGRQAGAAAGLGALTGQALGVGQEGTQDQLNRANLAMGVGEQRQGMQQQNINVEREIFQENDPFARAQAYLATVGGAPTTQPQYYQPQSKTQQALGIASMFTGVANGGQINRADGGGISNLAFGGGTTSTSDTGYKVPTSMEEFQRTLADPKTKKQVKETFVREQANMASSSPKVSNKISKRMAAMSQPSELEEAVIDTSTEKQKDLNRQRVQVMLNEKEEKMKQLKAATLSNKPYTTKQEGGEVIDDGEDKGILSRIIGGVKSGLSSLNSFDPFEGYTQTERMQVGLNILGATPQIGEGALGATARGAAAGIGAVEANRLALEKAKSTERLLRGSTTSDSLLNATFSNLFTPQERETPGYTIILQEAKAYARDKSIEAAEAGLIPVTGVQRDAYALKEMKKFAEQARENPKFMELLQVGNAGQFDGGADFTAMSGSGNVPKADDVLDGVKGKGIQGITQ